MMSNMKIFFLFFIIVSITLGQKNPIDIATVGSRQLRMNGQLNIDYNPATLGYSAIKKQSLISGQNSIDTIPTLYDNELIQNDSLMIEDSLELVEVDSLSIDKILLIADSVDIAVEEFISEDFRFNSPSFSIDLSFVSEFGNNAVTPDWINNQLFGGKDLRDPQQKEQFFNGIDNVTLQTLTTIGLPLLNIRFGPNLIALGQVNSYTSVNFSGLLNFIFEGIPIDEQLDLSSFDFRHITYLPISYSRGFQLRDGFIPFGRKSYAGIRASMLIGLAEFHTNNSTGLLVDKNGNTVIDMTVEANSSMIGENPGLGLGFGFDTGLITEINDRLTIGLSTNNLVSFINWSSGATFSSSLQGEVTPEQLSDPDSLSNYYVQNEETISFGYKTSLPTSIHFSGTYLAKNWVILDANFRFDIGDSYWASKTPILSFGSEFLPGSNTPINIGLSLGGVDGFKLGYGLTIKLKGLVFDIAFGQQGGLFRNRTGSELGFGLRIEGWDN